MNHDFLEIAKQNQNLIRKVCNMFCSDEDDRKDLFQDILIQLWKSFPTFRGESKVTTWMYRIALNIAITKYRKKKRTPERVSLSNPAIQLSYKDEGYEKTEKIRILYKAIDKLTEIEKSIVMLYMEEYSSEEISEIVGISENYVRVKVNRIKEKLKKIIVPQYD